MLKKSINRYIYTRSNGEYEMTEKRYKRIRDNNIFIVFDKQEFIKGNLDECSFEDEEVIDLLNEKEEKIKQLEKELSEMKDKAFVYGENLIWERSSTINEDTEELRIEIYGKEKAEQLKKQEIEEDKKLYTRKATIHDIKPVWEK